MTSEEPQLRDYETVDTVALVGLAEEVQSLALPLPLLACLESGATMEGSKTHTDVVHAVLNRHPAMVFKEPRAVDILMVSRDNLLTVADALESAGGFAIDLQGLPP